jgi:hypothetical protein
MLICSPKTTLSLICDSDLVINFKVFFKNIYFEFNNLVSYRNGICPLSSTPLLENIIRAKLQVYDLIFIKIVDFAWLKFLLSLDLSKNT